MSCLTLGALATWYAAGIFFSSYKNKYQGQEKERGKTEQMAALIPSVVQSTKPRLCGEAEARVGLT